MPRLFFALCPNDGVRERLASLTPRLTEDRCIKPENLHLTLHFIGQTGAQDCLIKHARKIFCQPFSLIINQYGHFKRAGVLWAGPKHYPETLARLAKNCARASVTCGCADEEKSFAPHVTLIRKISSKPELQRFDPFRWTVNSFYLMVSESDSRGVHYRIVGEFPMHG